MDKQLSISHFGKVLLSFCTAAVLLSSCAIDGYDDEQFDRTSGVQLASPASDDITITPNADGTQMTIAWPVVPGAGGFLVSLVNDADPGNPVVKDSVVDGSKVVLPRMEDQEYTFTIRTLGNTELDNTEAAEATNKVFSTFAPAYATIPDGTDLTVYFQENPLPDGVSRDEKPFDLVAGGHYTMSGNIDFRGNRAALRCTNEANPATITISGDASIKTYSGLLLKNLVLNCAEETNPLVQLDNDPDESIKNLVSTKGNYYYILDPMRIVNCKINDLADEVINANKTNYCVTNFIVDNSVFRFATSSSMSSSTYFDMYSNGGVEYFKATNSTFYNTTSHEMKYFLRYNNAFRPDRQGYTDGSVEFSNCTFYNIVKSGQICNYGGWKPTNGVKYILKHNIIVNTGNKQFVRRFFGGSSWDNVLSAGGSTVEYNTYFIDGADAWTMPDASDPTTWTGEAQYDKSGTIVAGDPGFKDADNGDFTVSGAAQIQNKCGDPRWIK